MARTFARTGRSMKNFEIIASSPLTSRRSAPAVRLHFGVDLLARDGAHDAADDDAVVLGQAFFDHAQFADELARLDFALLDHIVLVDDEHIASALIAAERDVGHQQGRLAARDGMRTRTK